MVKQLKIAKLELNEWVDWYESIEHSRRLNHIYERDLPKLKDKSMSTQSLHCICPVYFRVAGVN